MENFQFTEQELKYINDDIFNKENDIYATRLISDKYYIYATLPQGWYSFEVAEDEKMDCLNHLRQEGVNANITYTGIFVNIKKPRTIHILLSTDGEKIVKHLRSILVLQHKRLQQESLIQKDVKTRTDYGEQYNRESMYETAREILLDGKKVKMNGKTHKSLFTIMMEDYTMEIDKEAKYLRQAEKHLKEDDDSKFLDSFSKTMSRSKVTENLQSRLENAIDEAKIFQQYHYIIGKQIKLLKDTKEMSVEELNYALDLLKEHESVLLFRINGDTIHKSIYKAYLTTKKHIKQVEEELENRQETINL